MRKLQVKTKLIFSLSLILMVSFVVTSIINYRLSRDTIRREIMTSSLPMTSENIYSLIHSDLAKPINIASLMANDTFLRDWASAGETPSLKVIKYLATIKKRYGYFAAFFVSEITGNYYYPNGILKKIDQSDPHDVWYYDFLKTGKDYVLDVDTNEAAQNNLTIFINYRLEDHEGNLLGVTGVGLEMDRVATLLKKYQRTYDRSIFFVDRNGIIKVHTNKDMISTSLADWDGLKSSLDDILTPISQSKEFEYDNDGRHILLSIRYIPEFDWFLLVQQDEGYSLATARRNLIRTLLVGLAASVIIIFLTTVGINHYQRRLEHLASTDELTGTANRREFTRQGERAMHRFERYDMNFSLLMLDIDGLKAVNDTHGHLAGDRVITAVADICTKMSRTSDVVSRWGGDEFIVLIEGDTEEALEVAERIRRSVEAAKLPQVETKKGSRIKVSISCGIAQYRPGDDLEAVITRADKAMYLAKNEGKNSIRVA